MLDKFPEMFLFQTAIPKDLHLLSHEFVEIPLNILGILLVSFLLYVAKKTTLAVHVHLKIFVLNLLVASAVTSFFRILSLMVLVTVDPDIVHAVRKPFMALRYMAQYTGSFNLFFILCERLYATITAHCYEQVRAVKRIVLLIVLEWILVSIYILLSVVEIIDGLVAVIVEIVVNIFILIIFSLVVAVQALFYKKAKSNVVFRNRHSLSERYQISENFAATKAFYPTLVFLCTIAFTGTILYAISYTEASNDTLFIICDLLLAIKLFAAPIFLLLSHQSLCCTVRRLFVRSKVSPETEVTVSAASKNIVHDNWRMSTINIPDEGAVYFSELQKNWSYKR
ncbi:hypothetical protein QR680_008862 [Steinernema hermaphroditum]|uniref:G-protein coupled receptors family 1 profile domain-containing protein n=1 Tax=Steinernema hermaphroditum TaxID=289476 RepID=A0AA39M8F2_9BILA|nr:hypothetical protein QR680_008862 [Steinernema hermaphroditum]